MFFIRDPSDVSEGDKTCFAHPSAHGSTLVRMRKMVQKKANSPKVEEVLRTMSVGWHSYSVWLIYSQIKNPVWTFPCEGRGKYSLHPQAMDPFNQGSFCTKHYHPVENRRSSGIPIACNLGNTRFCFLPFPACCANFVTDVDALDGWICCVKMFFLLDILLYGHTMPF